jgi:DNA recombination protein RmuC
VVEVVLFVLGAVAALGLGWFIWARDAARWRERYNQANLELQAKVAEAAQTEPLRAEVAALRGVREEVATLKERERGFEEQRRQLLATGEMLRQQFEQLAGSTLQKSQQQFIEMATQTFAAHKAKAEAGLEKNKAEIQALLTPVADTLKRYEEKLQQVEAARVEGYGKLTQLLDQVSKGQERVSSETLKLATALRSSGKVAGRWGEEQCRNVLELAGLVEGVDYSAQTSVEGEAGRQRPDFTLTLPGNRKLVIDVKCSLDSFYAAAESDGEEDRARHLKAHAAAVRAHATGLASKAYEKSVDGAVDFVVLFVPGENFLAAAIEQDRTLMSDFMAKRLVLAGPINLIAVARTVAAMRDQARLAKQAAEIAKLGRDLYDSLRIMGSNVGAVQKSLESAVGNWNKLVGQLDSRVMLRARRFDQLGATTGLEAIPELRAIEQVPMLPASIELQAPAAEAAE